MMQDSRYLAKQAFRTRGHRDLVQRVGGVFEEIEHRLARQDKVRLLELGCGYGTVLLELRQRFGSRVVLHGMNRRPRDGDADALLRNAIERDLIVPGAPLADPLPTVVFGDVAQGLPFADDSLDIVYSQVAWLYFPDKVGVLREVVRILREDGLAKIDADEIRPELPQEYQRLVEIWQEDHLVPFGHYLRKHGAAFVPSVEGEHLRIGKSPGFGRDLTLVFQLDLGEICTSWSGVKCVYRLRAE
jgi:SAM-dependent methyltransferase